MTAPAVTVLLGLDGVASLGMNFTLDAGVAGILDNVDYTLAGTFFVVVSEYATATIPTMRGRSREVDQYQAGTASFTLRNENRDFDPTNTSSPYFPGVRPRCLVIIQVDDVGIFAGYVDDIQVDYQMPNFCTTTFLCVDGFTILANTQLESFSSPAGTSDVAVKAALDEVGYPAARNIETGATLVQASTQNNVAALTWLQTLARTENGRLFIDANGILNFLPHTTISLETQAYFTDNLSYVAGSPNFIGYQGVSMKSQSLLLYNIVQGTRTGGTQQQAQDAGSQVTYLPRLLQLGQLENASDADVLNLCEYLLGKYSQPETRFDTIVVELSGLDEAHRQTVLNLDIGDRVQVQRTPPGSGTPGTITIDHIIEGIAYSLDATNSSFLVTFTLGSLGPQSFFILDDAFYGLLDVNNKLVY